MTTAPVAAARPQLFGEPLPHTRQLPGVMAARNATEGSAQPGVRISGSCQGVGKLAQRSDVGSRAHRVSGVCAHILVAEDDEMQAELIRRLLLQEGHTAVVVHDGRSAIDGARSRRPDLVVLDLMLPEVDGFGVCRMLHQDGDVPVLMLTARSTEDDVLLGLELGADDYMTKPYSPRELMARIRTVLRRVVRPAGNSPVLRAGCITVDPIRHVVTCDGAAVTCTPANSPFSTPWPQNLSGSSHAGNCCSTLTATTGPPPNVPSTCTS